MFKIYLNTIWNIKIIGNMTSHFSFTVFFLFEKTLLPGKRTLWIQVSEYNPDCPRFLQEVHVLTRTRDLLCISQALYHHVSFFLLGTSFTVFFKGGRERVLGMILDLASRIIIY